MSPTPQAATQSRIVRRHITGIRHLLRLNAREAREESLARYEKLVWYARGRGPMVVSLPSSTRPGSLYDKQTTHILHIHIHIHIYFFFFFSTSTYRRVWIYLHQHQHLHLYLYLCVCPSSFPTSRAPLLLAAPFIFAEFASSNERYRAVLKNAGLGHLVGLVSDASPSSPSSSSSSSSAHDDEREPDHHHHHHHTKSTRVIDTSTSSTFPSFWSTTNSFSSVVRRTLNWVAYGNSRGPTFPAETYVPEQPEPEPEPDRPRGPPHQVTHTQ
jgi:hypothetical protein